MSVMSIRLALAAHGACLVCGCFPYQAVSSGAVGCSAQDIEIRHTHLTPGFSGPTRTWSAICQDREHLCSSSREGGAACTQVSPEISNAEPARAQRVERGFDAERQTPTVRAHARLDVRRWLELFARPRADQNVAMTLRLLKVRGVECDGVRLTLNGTPQASAPVRVQDEGPTYRLETTLGLELIRELQRPHPSLDIDGCGQTVTVTPESLGALAEFAVVYTDLARAETPPVSSSGETAEAQQP